MKTGRLLPLLICILLIIHNGSACAQALLSLPSDLKTIGEEAFAGSHGIRDVVLREGIERIEMQAFAGSGVKRIYLPGTLTDIAGDAFSGSALECAYCIEGTYAEQYCEDQGIEYTALSKTFEEALRANIVWEELALKCDDPIDGKTLEVMMKNALRWMDKADRDACLDAFMDDHAQTEQIQRVQLAKLLYGVYGDVIDGHDFRLNATATHYEVGGTYNAFSLWDCPDIDETNRLTGYQSDCCNYAICSFDRKTGDKIMELYDDWTFRPSEYVTVSSAAESLLHFARSFEEDPVYVNVTDARASVSRIDPLLYTGATTLPEATNQDLPDWRGYNISLNSMLIPGALSGNPDDVFTEANLDYIKETGANYVHVYLSWSYLQGPDFTCDSKVNLSRLAQLDELISWCMERDIHIQLVFNDIPNLNGNSISLDEWFDASNTVFADETVRDDVTAFWRMLAKRYADIPNNYLSFNLMNECDPDSDDAYVWGLGDAVRAIWNESPGRVVVADVHTPNDKVRGETMAELGCALSYHYYNLGHISCTRPDVEANDPGYYARINESMCFVNASLYGPTYWDTSLPEAAKGALKFYGSVGGAELAVTISDISWFDTTMKISSDGYTLYEGMEEYTYDEERDYIGVNKTVTVSIPQGAKSFEISCPEGSCFTMSDITLTRSDGKQITFFPIFDVWAGTPLAEITVGEDGSCSSTMQLEYIEQSGLALTDLIQIGEKYHVDVMVGELGIFESSPMAEGINQKAAECILKAQIDTFDKLGLAWCCEYIGRYTLATCAPYLEGIEYRNLEGSPYYANLEMDAFFKKMMQN